MGPAPGPRRADALREAGGAEALRECDTVGDGAVVGSGGLADGPGVIDGSGSVDGGIVLAGAERVLVGTAVADDEPVALGDVGSVGVGLGVGACVDSGSAEPVGTGDGDGLDGGGGTAGGALRVGRGAGGAGGAGSSRPMGTRSSPVGPDHDSSGRRQGAAGTHSAVAVGPALGVPGDGRVSGGG
ncbi:hypothetical protein ACGFIE_03905 [Micromonospora sp. NPDC049275]|uniref:hypothetical protein n=1 Tax=Micromonospora sp. NPDC049275 TaxID=3364268 RepID=UPI003713F35C